MTNIAGSFTFVWLGLWLLLSVLTVAAYPVVRRYLLTLEPQIGSLFLLFYWGAPLLLSLSISFLLFAPGVESILVGEHCHQACVSHVPLLESSAVSSIGLACAALLIIWFLVRLMTNLATARRLQNRFDNLSAQQAGYAQFQSPEPLVFTLGWWQPQVFVSSAFLARCKPDDLQIVLVHEWEHRRRRDSLRLLLAGIFGALLPARFLRTMTHDMQLLAEQACDFRAARQFDGPRVAETLVRVQKLIQGGSCGLPRHATAFGEHEVESRVLALLAMADRHRLSRVQVTLCALFATAGYCLAIDPLHHGTEWLMTLL